MYLHTLKPKLPMDVQLEITCKVCRTTSAIGNDSGINYCPSCGSYLRHEEQKCKSTFKAVVFPPPPTNPQDTDAVINERGVTTDYAERVIKETEGAPAEDIRSIFVQVRDAKMKRIVHEMEKHQEILKHLQNEFNILRTDLPKP